MTSGEAIKFLSHSDLRNSEIARWADLGCGNGTFTKALADILPPESMVHAVDKNKASLDEIPDRHNDVSILKLQGDFEKLTLPFQLDGILMANALHFVKNKSDLIQKLKAHLRPDGIFLMVEYEMEMPNTWVPYPITFSVLKELFNGFGFSSVKKIYERPSNYNNAMMYSVMFTIHSDPQTVKDFNRSVS